MKSRKKSPLLSFTFFRSICLTAILAFAFPQPGLATPFPGPDDFGYTATSIPGSLRDISATGTLVMLSDDQVSNAIAIPFSFNYYGIDYTELYISSNGFVTFTAGTPDGCCSGQPLPLNDSVNNIIAPFWEDLNGPPGNIRFETLGVAGSREFIVGFYNNPHFDDDFPVTFELILHEGSSLIELQYDSAPSDGGQHSIGIENEDGTIGLQVALGDVSFSDEGFLIENLSFDEFTLDKAEIDYKDEPDKDKLKIKGQFMLADISNGIDLPSEVVVVNVGTTSITIPAGSFVLNDKGDKYEFKGVIDGADIKMKFKEKDTDIFEFDFKADGVDMSDTTNPLNISLIIGDGDQGSTALRLKGKLKFKAKH